MNSTLIWIVFLGYYAYSSIAFQVIADKTNTPDGWWAWVPILSLFLMLAIAKRPGWWFVWILVPLVQIVPIVILFVKRIQRMRLDVRNARRFPQNSKSPILCG